MNRLLAWLAALPACACSISAFCQSSDPTRYQTALDAVIADVGNPETSFTFAEVATELGDSRAALSALERILLINPRLANIQLEVGVMYLQLGNPELGRYYITEALKAPNIPVTVRARAQSYLSEAVAQTRRHFFIGSVYSGYINQSNATAGPDSPFVSVLDPFTGLAVQGQLSPDALERDDAAFQVGTALGHSVVFSPSGRASWESRAQFDTTRYDDIDELDSQTWRVETGPQVSWAGAPGTRWTFRAYGTTGTDELDGAELIDASGGGLELQRSAGASSNTRLHVRSLDQEFKDRFDASGDLALFVSDRSGDYVSTDLSQYWQLGKVQWGLFLTSEQADAAQAYQSYDRFGYGGSIRVFFGNGGSLTSWSFFVSALQREADYDAPFPLVDPTVKRSDERLDGQIGFDVTFGRMLSLQVAAGKVSNDSNLPNYEYDKTTGSVFLTWRF